MFFVLYLAYTHLLQLPFCNICCKAMNWGFFWVLQVQSAKQTLLPFATPMVALPRLGQVFVFFGKVWEHYPSTLQFVQAFYVDRLLRRCVDMDIATVCYGYGLNLSCLREPQNWSHLNYKLKYIDGAVIFFLCLPMSADEQRLRACCHTGT